MPNATRILLVEDNAGDAELICEQLSDCPSAPPYEIEHVTTLRSALDRLATGRIELVLLDLGLPDSHGASTVMRVTDKAPSVPIVVISGFNDPEVRQQVLEAQAQDFLVKGAVDSDQLSKYIRGAREQRGARQSEAGAPQRPGLSAPDSPQPTVGGPTLIFEPDPSMFVTVNTILQVSGYETVHAVTPLALTEAARTGTPGLILLGLGSGIDDQLLVERLRALTETPIIALYPAGYIDRGGSMPRGVTTSLPKPPSRTTLLAALTRVPHLVLKTA